MANLILCKCGRNAIVAPYGATEKTVYLCKACCDAEVRQTEIQIKNYVFGRRPITYPAWRDRSQAMGD